MLDGLARLIIRRRVAVLVISLFLALAGGAVSTSLFGKLVAGGFEDPNSESGHAVKSLSTTFDQVQPNMTVLITVKGDVDDPAVAAEGTKLTRELGKESGLVDVTSYWAAGKPSQMKSKDGDKALITGTLTGDEATSQKRASELADAYEGEHAGLDVKFGGYSKFQAELLEQGQKDASTGEAIAIPLTLIVLVFVFGSLVSASLPLIVAIITMMLTMGLMWVLAGVTDIGSLAASVVTLLGLGLAIDYSLLFVNRYREELSSGKQPDLALRATMTSAGRTVIFSALTVAVASCAMLWFPLLAVRSMGYAGALTALLAGASALIVLPAVLVMLGDKIDKGRVFGRKKRAAKAANPGGDTENGFWHRLATLVMRRPLPLATITTLFLLLLGAPFLGINIGMPDERVMPDSSSARQVSTAVKDDFQGSGQNTLVVVAPNGASDEKAVTGYAKQLSSLPSVGTVLTSTGSYAKGDQVAPAGAQSKAFAAKDAVYFQVSPTSDDPDVADKAVTEIRDGKSPFDIQVGGMAATNKDAASALVKWLPYALGSLLIVMLALLFLVTGSVLLPVMAIVLSLLSLTATFGALVWIFQDGHLAGLFGGFTPTGNIAATVPVMLFGLAFGLAMDYQVFLLSRMREEYELTGSPTKAVTHALERTGRIVTAAAVAIAIVFLAFTVSDISLVKAYGVGLPLAVLMDATLIRGVLLPAMMRLGGKATWWAPEGLQRVHARFGLREEARPKTPQRDLEQTPAG
ncbi:MMPL family transporter [Streptomyces sp. NPDC048441]|uniref:MMPL family transporter n=1 Tax=Streptomyces sp. NPDC048441 TaxID=3365552 RepID=UPI00371F443D